MKKKVELLIRMTIGMTNGQWYELCWYQVPRKVPIYSGAPSFHQLCFHCHTLTRPLKMTQIQNFQSRRPMYWGCDPRWGRNNSILGIKHLILDIFAQITFIHLYLSNEVLAAIVWWSLVTWSVTIGHWILPIGRNEQPSSPMKQRWICCFGCMCQ